MAAIPQRMLARDLGLLVLAGAVWAADAALRHDGGLAAGATAVLAGVLATAGAYVAHEWGHLLAAHLCGSRVTVSDRLSSPFLFRFDPERNTRAQFLAMSAGGFAATGVVVVLFLSTLPLDAWSGRVALALTGLGVLATLVTELPPAWRVLRGGPLPRGGAVYEPPPDAAA